MAEGTLAADGSLAASNVVAGTKGTREGGPGRFSIPFGPGHDRGFGGPGRIWVQIPGQDPNQPDATPGTSSDSGANG